MKSNESGKRKSGFNYWVAAAFIMVGFLLLGRNLGLLDSSVFHFIVSWKMLLIALGVYLLTRKEFIGSFVLIAVGAYFLLDFGSLFGNLFVFYWPAVFIVIGVIFLVKQSEKRSYDHFSPKSEYSQYTSTDGFFNIENNFGSIQQAIMDEELKGGFIRNSFGSVVLDLRRTSLPVGQTYIDINCQFGGVEIYIPSNWFVKSELRPFLGGYNDSRFVGMTVDESRVLIIRGEASFSGVEVKS